MAWVASQVLLMSLVCTCLLPNLTIATITIENNGYRGVEVVIHEDIPEDLNLLETIKEMLRRSSSLLYKATHERAHLEEVTIVLPTNWSSKPEYKTVPDDDYLSEASVRIAPPNPSYNQTPYTLQPGGCGEFGRYIHLTPDFLLKFENPAVPPKKRNEDSRLEGLAKVFLHEWFHLRYGVFNEAPSKDRKFPQFYKASNGMLRPNTCPAWVKGKILRSSNTALPCFLDRLGQLNDDCTFYPDLAARASGPRSITFMPYLPDADLPCEDDNSTGRLHNADAPNEHNDRCKRRSVRNVMESGPDFSGGRNLPRAINSTEPKIDVHHLKKDVYPGYVLILDVSGSMQGKPWEELKLAASRAIKYKAKSQCPVGMVSFSDTSKILAQLTPINPANREQLLKTIPAGVGGYTAIGQGLQAGLQVLGAGGNPVEKGKLILITDGEENRTPNVVDVIPELQKAKVIVYGLAFGDKASKKIEDLCQATGGKGWLFNSALITQSLDSMLDEIFQNCGPVKGRPVINKNGAFKLLVGDTKAGLFYAEQGVAKTTVSISYDYPGRTTAGKVPTVTLTSPSGKVYFLNSPEYNEDPSLKSVMFEIPNTEPGKWTYNFINEESNDIVINLMITSEGGSGPDVADPIRVKSWINAVNLTYPQMPKIYAEVKKGQLPVLNVAVTANILKPNGDVVQVSLADNGIGADATANDGIYTEFYTQFTGDGRYAIDVIVENHAAGAAATPTNVLPNQSGAPEFPYLPPEHDRGPALFEFPLSDLKVVEEEFDSSVQADESRGPQAQGNPTLNETVAPFERFVTTGTFILSKWVAKDLIAPGRISDLMVTASNRDNRTVTLQWTTPGDDMFSGQATAFQVRYHPNVSILVDSFEGAPSNFTILDGTLEPLEAYREQVIQLQLPPEDQLPFDTSSGMIYHLGVRAVDEEMNAGEVSNLVLVNFVPPPPPPTAPPTRTPRPRPTTEPPTNALPMTGPPAATTCRRYIQLYSLYLMGKTIFSPQSSLNRGLEKRKQRLKQQFWDMDADDWGTIEDLTGIPKLCQALIKALENESKEPVENADGTGGPAADRGGDLVEESIDTVSHIRRRWLQRNPPPQV